MSRVNSLFVSKEIKPSEKATEKNTQGYPAFKKDIYQEYLQSLLTNTLGNTFYASQKDLLDYATELHNKMVVTDPEFMAKAIKFARNKGYMRTNTIFGLAKLSSVDKSYFEDVFNSVVLTPNDLIDFTTILKSLRGSEGGRKVKRVMANWLNEKLSQYWAIKYGSKKSGTYSLKDLIRISHPKVTDKKDLFAYLLDKETSLDNLDQVKAFERLKKATTDDEKIAAIKEGRLPADVATTFAGNSEKIWKAIVPQMPIMALVMNLAAIEKHNALEANKAYIEGVLTNSEQVQKSKVLPYTFKKALDHVSSAWLKDALRDAFELSVENIADIEGKTCVALDISGSMSGTYVETGALFGICLMKKAKLKGKFYLYDTQLDEFAVSMRDSTLTQAALIKTRGATNTSLPILKLLNDKEKVDNIILITDEQQNSGAPAMDVFDKYRKSVNPNVKLFVINVAPYANSITNNDPNIYMIYGWSEKVLNFISLASQGFGNMATAIRNGHA